MPHEQAAALHQKLAQDAELAKLYERLKHTINLVRETVASPAAQTADQPTPLKLSDQRRQKLLQHFKTVAPKEFVPPRRRAMSWLVPVGIAAALLLLLAFDQCAQFHESQNELHGAFIWNLVLIRVCLHRTSFSRRHRKPGRGGTPCRYRSQTKPGGQRIVAAGRRSSAPGGGPCGSEARRLGHCFAQCH